MGENPTCTMSNIAITAETFRRAGGFDTDMLHAEDLAWLIRAAASGAVIKGINNMIETKLLNVLRFCNKMAMPKPSKSSIPTVRLA